MIIKVLGPGCMNCKTLERRTLDVLAELKLEAVVAKVEKTDEIVSYGVLRTPGLVINEKLVWQGSVPTTDTIKQLVLSEKEKAAAQ